jgi:aryl-alcohol dehydrogenase-like predicted oxidoreductase
MQKFLDAGFTSFQLKSSPIGSRRDSSKGGDGLQEWGEEQIFSRLRKETPAFALRQCHLVVPMEIPNANAAGTVTATSIRKTVLTTLDRTGGDCIDSLQLSQSDYVPSPYTFDVLDCLEDLKREGHVRSVTGNNLSWRLIREAHRCGFAIDSNQVDGNLLNPTAFDNPDQQLACQDLGTKLLVSGPLAGALLSDRHYVDLRQSKRRGGRMLSLPRKESTRPFTTSEWYHVKKSMVHWGDCQGDLEPNPSAAARWKLYQEKVLSALHDIAQKHDVSMATVALRWTLQVDHVASAVVTCRLLSGDNGDPRLLQDRSQQLRQVFKFELDEDDMDRLWQVSGRVVPEPFDRDRDEDEEFMEMMESEKGLFLPPRRNRKPPPRDGSSRTLWL